LYRFGFNKTEIMYAVKWKGMGGKGFWPLLNQYPGIAWRDGKM
jgi:hypothetical protein